jgi:hypothetical protein
VSGNHRTPSGGYRTPSGEYRNASGGYRTPSGEYRNASGARRSVSGSHRVNPGTPSRWRLFLILAGVTAGVAVCAVSAVIVLMLGGRSSESSGRISAQQPSSQQGATGGERSAVPDACSLVTDQQADKLVPHFDRNQLNSASNTDTHSQCTWTLFAAKSGYQLTVELRVMSASGGRSATEVAKQTFETEQASDDAGKGGLSTTQHITSHKPVEGVGDAAYVAYSVDDSKGFGSQGFGDAGLNARTANVLITVHYGGSEDGSPMGADQTIAGATETAKNLIHALSGSA